MENPTTQDQHSDESPLPQPTGSRIYGDRDTEKLGRYYIRHIRAMTSEGLNSKSEIAAELAHRDYIISVLVDCIENLADYLADEPHPNDGGSSFLAQSQKDLKRILSENVKAQRPT